MAGELASMALAAGATRRSRAAARDRSSSAQRFAHRSRAVRPSDRRPRSPPRAGRCRRRRRGGDGGWVYGAAAGRRGASACPTTAGSWCARRGGTAHPAIGLVLFLGGIALAVALGAYPVVRGLTRRLERLQAGVETLGAGNLSARVNVEGKDEIARLAEQLQPRCRPDRGTGGRAPHAARQCVARIAHAAVAHPARHRSARSRPTIRSTRPRWSATSPNSI